MAGSVNRVILVGRLGKDPESRYTQQGVAITRFSLATDEQWTDKSGEKQRRTEWHNIVAWNKLGEICKKYLVKGKLVYVEGSLQTRSWETEGKKHYKTEVRADNMVMLSSAPSTSEEVSGGAPQPMPEAESAPEQPPEIGDDDVPF
ncbi:MAG: single-stranded DNA-binding protein [Acidobacteriia bacterium]|nr:single-stranded DNA-binding protein [Terriglobia bacterium]